MKLRITTGLRLKKMATEHEISQIKGMAKHEIADAKQIRDFIEAILCKRFHESLAVRVEVALTNQTFKELTERYPRTARDEDDDERDEIDEIVEGWLTQQFEDSIEDLIDD